MAKWFKFSYYPYLGKDLTTEKLVEVFRPTVPIEISYGSNFSGEFQALVDSGSDKNLFPAKLGEFMRIDVKKGKARNIMGIGGKNIVAYTHKVKLYIAKLNFDMQVDFSYEQEMPLLGRDGFFNLFKHISFSEKMKEVTFKF